jgi:hypothetical protein
VWREGYSVRLTENGSTIGRANTAQFPVGAGPLSRVHR